MRELMLIGLLAILGCYMQACGKPDTYCNPSGKLYSYGSSISAGLAQPVYTKNVADSFCKVFVQYAHGGSSMFDKNSIGQDNQYDTITGTQSQWESGSIIIWDTGINDAILHGSDPVYQAAYSNGLDTLINVFLAHNVTVYVGTPLHNCNEPRFGSNAVIDQYASIVRSKVSLTSKRIRLVDFTSNFVPSNETTIDCIHPNVYGNKLMSDFLLKQFVQ